MSVGETHFVEFDMDMVNEENPCYIICFGGWNLVLSMKRLMMYVEITINVQDPCFWNHNKCTKPMFLMRQKYIFKFKLISGEEYSSCLLNLMMAWGSPTDFSGFIPSARETPSSISGNKQYGEMPCLSANFQFRWWSFCFDIRPSCRRVDNFLELDDPYFLYFRFWA